MAQIFLNNARAVLAESISAESATLTIASGVGLPDALSADDFFLLTLFKDEGRYGSGVEIVRVVGIDGSELAVERGQENTAAVPHAAGELIEARITAESLERVGYDGTAQEMVTRTGIPSGVSAPIAAIGVQEGVRHLAVSTSGRYVLVMTGSDALLCDTVADTLTPLPAGSVFGGSSQVAAAAFSDDETMLVVAGGHSRTCGVYRLSDLAILYEATFSDKLMSATFSQYGERLLVSSSAASKSAMTLLDTTDWSVIRTIDLSAISTLDVIHRAVISPDGQFAAVSFQWGLDVLLMVDVETGAIVNRSIRPQNVGLVWYGYPLYGASWSADSRFFIGCATEVGNQDDIGAVYLYDRSTDTFTTRVLLPEVVSHLGLTESPYSMSFRGLSFLPGDETAVVVAGQYLVTLDVANFAFVGEPVRVFPAEYTGAATAAFATGGSGVVGVVAMFNEWDPGTNVRSIEFNGEAQAPERVVSTHLGELVLAPHGAPDTSEQTELNLAALYRYPELNALFHHTETLRVDHPGFEAFGIGNSAVVGGGMVFTLGREDSVQGVVLDAQTLEKVTRLGDHMTFTSDIREARYNEAAGLLGVYVAASTGLFRLIDPTDWAFVDITGVANGGSNFAYRFSADGTAAIGGVGSSTTPLFHVDIATRAVVKFSATTHGLSGTVAGAAEIGDGNTVLVITQSGSDLAGTSRLHYYAITAAGAVLDKGYTAPIYEGSRVLSRLVDSSPDRNTIVMAMGHAVGWTVEVLRVDTTAKTLTLIGSIPMPYPPTSLCALDDRVAVTVNGKLHVFLYGGGELVVNAPAAFSLRVTHDPALGRLVTVGTGMANAVSLSPTVPLLPRPFGFGYKVRTR